MRRVQWAHAQVRRSFRGKPAWRRPAGWTEYDSPSPADRRGPPPPRHRTNPISLPAPAERSQSPRTRSPDRPGNPRRGPDFPGPGPPHGPLVPRRVHPDRADRQSAAAEGDCAGPRGPSEGGDASGGRGRWARDPGPRGNPRPPLDPPDPACQSVHSTRPTPAPPPRCPQPMFISEPPATTPPANEVAAVAALAGDYRRLRDEIAKVIIGQDEVVEQLLIGLFARGHVLLVGVPGLAKTLLVSTVAQILSLSFRRIQFTPDMMPSDITGTDILQDDPETGRRRFAFIPGPVFANIDPRRRDQPDPAQDPGRAPGSDAGAARHRRRPDLPPARPVLRPGHAEPDRAGGDVPPARGPARPLHAQRPRALPDRRRGAGDPPPAPPATPAPSRR